MDGHGRKIALVTGASGGIGRATALALADAGYDLIVGARREALLEDTVGAVRETGRRVFSACLDVRDRSSVDAFVQASLAAMGHVDVLVNNAGLARGVAKIAEQTDEDEWQEMLDTNVMGLLRVTRLVLPRMIERGRGHIVNIGSTAAHEVYAGGSVYCGSKFAVRAITLALRQELLGLPIRVTEIDPGMTETDFSRVRFRGDERQAGAVYAGAVPLTPEDVADVIVFAVTRKSHVNLDNIIMRPVDQAVHTMVHRRAPEKSDG